MDYVVGSVAALLSGNVTPNRPKLVRRALTPIKHQASPNVTPKSELLDDRSILLSPSLQKKKAIIKKSPKRIFQNPDLDVTSENENNSNPSSPKADKVKKHLNEELEAGNGGNKTPTKPKSPKKKRDKFSGITSEGIPPEIVSPQSLNENSPKKQKKRKISVAASQDSEDVTNTDENKPVKKNKKLSISEDTVVNVNVSTNNETPKKKKKKSKKPKATSVNESNTELPTQNNEGQNQKSPKKNKKRKNKSKGKNNQVETKAADENREQVATESTTDKPKKSKKKNKNADGVNPNAITDRDSDSEHESDDEIVSENEEANKEVLDTGPAEKSSDEEEEATTTKKAENKDKTSEPRSDDEVKRTLFVGNVPFSKKCKKEVKKIFSKYGDIETVRIRTIPVKDARVTPKLAVIKSELHPERSTVNVYIKYKDVASVDQALAENNTVLNGCHLRVSRSASSGAEHDPRCSVFVGNVPFALEDEALRAKFETCGEIVSVRIVRDKKTNAGKGFAYVNFASKDGVELALALSEEDLTIKNRILRVKRSTQSNNKQKPQSGPAKKFPGKNFQGKNEQGKPFQGKGSQGKTFQGKKPFKGNGQGFRQRQGEEGQGEGAVRRLMHKRKNQDGSEGPPNKRQKNINQPQREKKTRKEFVGMTAEKKKKQTFNKGQKKKKALSEILTKYS